MGITFSVRLCVSVIFALVVVRLENVGANRTVDASMRRCRHNTWHTHIGLGYIAMGVRTLTRCDFSLLKQGGLWPFNTYVWLVNQLRYADIVNIMEVNI